MTLTELSIKRPLLIIVIFFTLILFGVISYTSLNYNLLPRFEASVISVVTAYRGASAEEVETSVTKPLEEALASIEGVKHISASSREGISSVIIELKTGTSTIVAQQDAERRINQARALLPEDADDPVVNRFNSEELPVLRLSASGDLSETELYDLIKQQIKPILSNVDGVGQVNLIGGNQREIRIALDKDRLSAYNLSPVLVNQALATANVSFPAGNVESNLGRYAIRLDAKFQDVEAIRRLVIAQTPAGSRVLLGDVAVVTDGPSESKTVNRINGLPGVGIEITKQADANAVKVSEGIKARLDDLVQQYASKNLKFDIAVDQSVYTLASADAVMHDLMLAVFIVAGVMLLFLHSLRSSFFVLIALPSAMIPTFILMYAFGFSLNLMTLMALSLVVGILVDDSIVILENIFRHMEMGKDKRRASLEGRSEIGFTAVAITLVDVVVFVPMALSTGMIGNILREFSLVVVFSTLMSLLVAFTLTPLLASRFGKLEHLTKDTLRGRFFLGFEYQIERLKEFYGRTLSWALGHKRYILLGIVLLFVGAFALVPSGFIGTAFMSESDRGEINISLEMSNETPLYTTNQAVLRAEEIVMKHPEVRKVFTSVGTQAGNALVGSNSTANIAEMTIQMVDKGDRRITQNQFGALMRDEISAIPGVKVTIKPVGLVGSGDAPIQIAVRGTDLDSIWEAARKIRSVVAGTAGTDYVEFSTKTPQNEIDIRLDRDRVLMAGLSVPEIGNALQIAFRGNDQLKYTEGGEEYAINLISEKADRQDIGSVRNISIRNSRGVDVRLSDVAEISERQGQTVLQRYDRLKSINVTGFASGRPMGTIIAEIQAGVGKLDLPSGVLITYLGQAQQQADAFGSLGFAMLIGFVLVYLIMVALYESVVYPFVVMFSIPVALIGALLALALTMESLTIFAIVGLIMLMGLVAKNGILIVDFANHLKAQGHGLKESLIEAGKERLRPILMTTIAMICGMLPIAFSTGSGAEVKNGMAWVIIGGLTSSLVLTLLLVPTIYYIVDKSKERLGRLFGSRKQPLAPVVVSSEQEHEEIGK